MSRYVRLNEEGIPIGPYEAALMEELERAELEARPARSLPDDEDDAE